MISEHRQYLIGKHVSSYLLYRRFITELGLGFSLTNCLTFLSARIRSHTKQTDLPVFFKQAIISIRITSVHILSIQARFDNVLQIRNTNSRITIQCNGIYITYQRGLLIMSEPKNYRKLT